MRRLIPAVYSCSKGLVVDFCMRAGAEEIPALMGEWNFKPWLELNGRKMRMSRGCAVGFSPCQTEETDEAEAEWAVSHYGLDPSCGWGIFRYAFLWGSKRRPEIKTLSLSMKQRPEQIPGPHFKIRAPGDSFSFIHPVRGTKYTLTVQKLEQQVMPQDCFGDERWIYPTHFAVMSYTLLPAAKERITVSDSSEGDQPVERKKAEDPFAPAAGKRAVCVIGGADGPTAVALGGSSQEKLCAAYSALYFEPVRHEMEWRITFYEKRFEDMAVILL